MSAAEPVVGIAGLTHLGINTAAAFAERSFRTVWYSTDAGVAEAVDRGELGVTEPGLDDLVARNRARISVTADAGDLAGCDVVYIATDVPTDDDGHSDLTGISALIGVVAKAVSQDCILVVLSQVPPGFTRGLDYPKDRLVYQVETLIFGRAVERAMHPERYIVGLSDPAAPLPPAYRTLLEAFGCPILPMRYESAELAKIAINCCLVAMVSTANTLAELCESVGADWSEIVPALRLDRRIGEHAYLSPGLGIAGGNLERDLATVIRLAGKVGSDSGVVEAWVANSLHRKGWAYRTLDRELLTAKPEARIAVLGLAYKQDTHSTRNSPSLAMLDRMRDRDVVVYDPVVKGSVVPFAQEAADALDACDGADALAIMTPWAEFRALDPAAIASRMRGRLLLDPFAVLDAGKAAKAGLMRRTLGVATPAEN